MPARDADDTGISSAPLYNTTWILHRLSPLHLAPSSINATDSDTLLRAALPAHAKRLAAYLRRETQFGSSLAGLGGILDDENDALARAGPLKSTAWTWLSSETSVLEKESGNPHGSGPDGFGLLEGVQIALEFERTGYTALLLRRSGSDADNGQADGSGAGHSQRAHLPLLLLRMPLALRTHLLSYVAAHFDARADALHIPDYALASALEAYLGAADSVRSNANSTPLPHQDVQLTLSFPGPALRSLDISVPGTDVAGFLQRGADLKPGAEPKRSTSKTGTDSVASKTAHDKSMSAGPFTRALATYLTAHLALDCAHKDVSLSRVACAGFALGREGRAKIWAPGSGGGPEGGAGGKAVIQGIVDVLWDLVQT